MGGEYDLYCGNELLHYHEGHKPVLVLSIHSCNAVSGESKKVFREFRLTRELCDRLVGKKPEYYFLKYTGYRSGCKDILRDPIEKIVAGIVQSYGSAGVMSLHCRGKSKKLEVDRDVLFELGDRSGATLDVSIVTELRGELKGKGISFDYYNQRLSGVKPRRGGWEIKLIHDLDLGIQVAQLEFNEWLSKNTKDTWMQQYFDVCVSLGDIFCDNLR